MSKFKPLYDTCMHNFDMFTGEFFLSNSSNRFPINVVIYACPSIDITLHIIAFVVLNSF